ncbi:MAG TPA: hypothetical protein EYG71_05455 [Leucothrix sp.]|nr:hypothetical protein [Leucothrix sp.]
MKSDTTQENRDKIAEKMGFDAYGATQDMTDPVAKTVNRMLDHIHKMDERMDKMCQQVQKLGGKIDFEPLPELKDAELTECNPESKK